MRWHNLLSRHFAAPAPTAYLRPTCCRWPRIPWAEDEPDRSSTVLREASVLCQPRRAVIYGKARAEGRRERGQQPADTQLDRPAGGADLCRLRDLRDLRGRHGGLGE